MRPCGIILFIASAALGRTALADDCVKACETACYNHDRACPSAYTRGTSAITACLTECKFEPASECELLCYNAPLDRRGRDECLRACNHGAVNTYFRTTRGQLFVRH